MQTLAMKNSLISLKIVVKVVMLKTFTRALNKVIIYTAVIINKKKLKQWYVLYK